MRKTKNTILLAPTDLSNFLSCRHLSMLDLSAAIGHAERPVRYGPMIDELKARGAAHEQQYLENLEAQGLVIAGGSADESTESGLEGTVQAMRDGADVIYQATLSDETWSGRADFLCKVDRSSDLGDWSYEVTDTKLARDTKAGTILQLCVYSYLLEKLQGHRPEKMYVVTPGNDFSPIAYRLDDYSAYFRLLENGIANFIQEPDDTYPELVSHCDFCPWWDACEKRRRGDDHLCYVAGISSSQIQSLRTLGVNRLGDLAALGDIPDPPKGSREALLRVREQARVQVTGRETNTSYHELTEPFGAEHGLALLPEPTEDDIFLDFEGNHFAEKGVQEYLTGYVARNAEGERVYHSLWATTLKEERLAFEQFMDFTAETRQRNPKAHIYHFAHYEPTALKRLMGRFASRETQLDELLRGGAFVDLYKVVRRSLIASVERYSIKDLEPFCGYNRKQDLASASMSRRIIEHAIEAGDFDAAIEGHREKVEAYNREDCESAERLRDWLEQLRVEVISGGHDLPRPELQGGDASEEIGELDRELQRLRDALLEGVPDDPADRNDEQHARFALAHMMEFHRREDKASWWEYFRLLDLDPQDYADERKAIVGLEFQETLAESKAPLHRYRFPPQELDARTREGVYINSEKPIGKIDSVDYAAGTIDIKKTMAASGVHPDAAVLFSHVGSRSLRESLMRLGESVLANGFVGQAPYAAALELLLRRPSSLIGPDGSLQQSGESTVNAACRLASGLNGHVLAIQGPPGTGKTYTGAQIICALKKAGLKVGVTAVSHKVIENLLEGAMEEAEIQGINLRAVHKNDGIYEGAWGVERSKDYSAITAGLESGEIDVLGGTAWCWVREDFQQSVDVLIVDEAGQMSLSNVLAAAPAGRGLVLLGDPQQLEQPLQSSHPEGSEVSALYHLLDGHETMPTDKGLFLSETYRLHPDIARFTSEVYYDGKVSARPGLDKQAILVRPGKQLSACGSGLRYLPIEHAGNKARSSEEAEAIASLIHELLSAGSFQDKDGQVSRLTTSDILIVAPYNAQVAMLSEAIPEMQGQIGTVDKFQGQQAPVVVYSLTSSTPDDAPRGMDFLYDRHRFNVATSRAKALCVVVGTPALFEPECKTPKQMRKANGFCRYLELAEVVA